MEYTIKKIISIDKDAEDSKKNLEKLKKEVIEKKLGESDRMAEQIRNEKAIEMENINKKINDIKGKIISDTMNNILSSR